MLDMIVRRPREEQLIRKLGKIAIPTHLACDCIKIKKNQRRAENSPIFARMNPARGTAQKSQMRVSAWVKLTPGSEEVMTCTAKTETGRETTISARNA